MSDLIGEEIVCRLRAGTKWPGKGQENVHRGNTRMKKPDAHRKGVNLLSVLT